MITIGLALIISSLSAAPLAATTGPAVAVAERHHTPVQRADDVDGTWTGTLNAMGNEVQVTWTFKSSGTSLSGQVDQGGGMAMSFKDGKIDGKNISFVLNVDMEGQSLAINYKGVVSPTEIKLTAEVGGQSFEYVVKKKQ